MKLQMKLNGECLIGGIVKGIVFYRTTGYNDLVASKGKKLHGHANHTVPPSIFLAVRGKQYEFAR